MKKSDIREGVTYAGKGGNAARKVLWIWVASQNSPGFSQGLTRPAWHGDSCNEPAASELLVKYEQVRGPRRWTTKTVFLSQFAAWAHKVDDGDPPTIEELRAALRDAEIMSNEAGRAGIEWRSAHRRILEGLS